MSPQPLIVVAAPAASADPRAQDLAQALAGLRDPANDIRTPTGLASDLLAEALLQRRYGQARDAATPAEIYAPAPSPSLGVPAPSAPAGTASAASAALSPAAGAAMAFGGDPGALPPPQATPSPRPGTQLPLPRPSGGVAPALVALPPQVLNDARAALQKGADPARVRARLAAHGYDPRGL